MKKIYLLIICLIAGAQLKPVYSQATLNLKFFIESFYTGLSSKIADTAVIELRDPFNTNIIVESFKGIFQKNGTMACTYSNSVIGNPYYIAINHRSSIQTWSATAVTMSATTNYDFSASLSQAYANNLSNLGGGIFGVFSGDLNQDGNVDLFDFIILDFGINNGLFGYYASDLNGDGNTDLLDFPVLDTNIKLGIFIHRP